MVRIAGAVLAAGSGSRMGGPKAELVVAGERLVDRAVRVLRDGGCDPVIAVVRDGVAVPGALVAVNRAPERGMRSSLELAVGAVGAVGRVGAGAGADALVVLLADMPGVSVADVRAVAAAWHPGRVAIGCYGERRGHPAVMSLAHWREALCTAGPDEGARAFLTAHPHLVDEVAVDGDPGDVDRPADLARWRQRS